MTIAVNAHPILGATILPMPTIPLEQFVKQFLVVPVPAPALSQAAGNGHAYHDRGDEAEEADNHSEDRFMHLPSLAPHTRHPTGFAGRRASGRGLTQLTGRANYADAALRTCAKP